MTIDLDAQIAGSNTAKLWIELRKQLEQKFDPKLWDDAFNQFFLARLETRYLKPLKLLREQKQWEGEGFSIVTIQCALIEFLAAMRAGKVYRYSEPETTTTYNRSGALFATFLGTTAPFNQWLNRKSAKEFYSSVRCALLHEAGTRNNWKIRVDGPTAIDVVAKRVNRNKLQDAIDQYLRGYESELQTSKKLRRNFIRRFSDIVS